MVRAAWRRLPPLARALVPGLVLSALALVGFVAILNLIIDTGAIDSADAPLLEWLAAHREPWLTSLMTGITHLFGPVVLPIVVAAGAGVWWWRTRSWRDPLFLVEAMVFATILSSMMKAIVERPRPPESVQSVPGFEHSFSFPSGHTTATATLVLVLGYLLWREERRGKVLVGWAVASALMIALVGFSRMYLGYHFLGDVLGGACLGVFTLGLVMCAARWRDLQRRTQPQGG